ncbi:MAG: ATPase, T2SS/T4P/T4SS family [Deltaproteobacteria bacterium]|nr:ATPase, T2SS/T4P/T4SS family [Deltaproteobacteria bacterium]
MEKSRGYFYNEALVELDLKNIDLPSVSDKSIFSKLLSSWAKERLTVVCRVQEENYVLVGKSVRSLSSVYQAKRLLGPDAKIVVVEDDKVLQAYSELRSKLMSDPTLTTLEASADGHFEESTVKFEVTEAGDEDAPIIRYVNSLIFRASQQKASDIHIEPFEDCVKIRFRIDGVLYDVAKEDKAFSSAIISRIKILAGMDIAERRLPQDGRIGVTVTGREIDLRVSSIPTQFGERVVLRLLDKSGSLLELEDLGLEGENLKMLSSLITKPNGIILVTGPTGSGKTTTLYACLSRINTEDKNILTVEDPIEYQIPGIGQMQVNPKIGFTFAAGLRSILRQDPDVVMVGEIRDTETAEIAIQASLTGHLVFSTLHTNDAPGAITRLIDLNVEPFLVASSLLCVLAQRLVRKLCPDCREARQLNASEFRSLGWTGELPHSVKIYGPGSKDCSRCKNVRYVGRTGIHELLLIRENLRSLIVNKSDSKSIRQVAESKNGFKSLRVDGLQKVLNGVTSVEEVLMVTHEE